MAARIQSELSVPHSRRRCALRGETFGGPAFSSSGGSALKEFPAFRSTPWSSVHLTCTDARNSTRRQAPLKANPCYRISRCGVRVFCSLTSFAPLFLFHQGSMQPSRRRLGVWAWRRRKRPTSRDERPRSAAPTSAFLGLRIDCLASERRPEARGLHTETWPGLKPRAYTRKRGPGLKPRRLHTRSPKARARAKISQGRRGLD